MHKINSFSDLQKKYSGMYIATNKPRGDVIVASKSLATTFKKAAEKGFKNPAVEYIEPGGVIAIYAVKISLRK